MSESRKPRGLQRPPRAATGSSGKALESSISAGHPLLNQAGRDSRALLVPLSRIVTSPDQPRKSFDEASIAELAEDIRINGLINPLTVYEEDGAFYLVAGERRYRALGQIGAEDAPVRVIHKSEARAVQLAENLHREDLPLMDEAQALADLRAGLGLTVRELAAAVHKSRSYVDRRLQILKWPDDVQDMLRQQPGLLTKAADLASVKDDDRRQQQISQLLGETPAEPASAEPKAPRGRQALPFKVTERPNGGFDVQLRFRPGHSDPKKLISELRVILSRLEDANS